MAVEVDVAVHDAVVGGLRGIHLADLARFVRRGSGIDDGVGMGVAFGWVGVMSLPIDGATPVLSVPWLQLVGVCVVAIVSALIASWLPGRRAAKVSPSEALATE